MKKVFLILFVLILSVTPISVFAATTPGQNNIVNPTGWAPEANDLRGLDYFSPLVDDLNSTGNVAMQNYSAMGIGDITNGIARQIVGSGGTANGQAYRGGAIQFFASSIGGMYEAPPASTYAYINYVARNAGFESPVKPAYAATGIGFTALDPVMKLWQVMRNLAYLALSVVFVVVGLMIVLRVKIDPKTVISIQNALPKMILSMILITFSYPIAGFMVDLMYVLIGVIMGIAGSTKIISDVALKDFQDGLGTQTIFGFVGVGNWWGASTAAARAISDAVSELAGVLNIGWNGSVSVAGVTGALGGLIIAVAILYALFKTWLSLLGAYVNILVGTIFSPFAMLGEAIPGVSGLSTWLRSMAAAILSFPTVVMMLVFGKAIMEYGNNAAASGATGTAFVPPLIGGNNSSAVTSLIGLGILLMIPKAVEMLGEFLKAPPFKYGMAWQESVGAGQGALQKGWGTAYGDRWSRVSAAMQKKMAEQEVGGISDDPTSWTGRASRVVNDPIGSIFRRGQNP